MKSRKQVIARSMRIAALPLLLIAAGVCGQSALAGGNASGQPSGSTVAGATTTPPPAVSALTAIVMGGAGPTVTTTTTTNTTTGAVTTTRTVSVPATVLSASFAAVGLSLPAPGGVSTFVGAGGTFTVTNNSGTVTVSFASTGGTTTQ